MKFNKYTVSFFILAFSFLLVQGCKKEEKVEWKVKDPKEEINNHPEPQFKKEGELSFVKKDGKEISKVDIEVSDNAPERAQGLMWRKAMGENQAMLFIFPAPEQQAFWMKNTIMPLDIIFIDEDNVIVKIHKNAVPYSEKSLPSEKNSIFVVETIAGYCDKNGVKEGDKIKFDFQNK